LAFRERGGIVGANMAIERATQGPRQLGKFKKPDVGLAGDRQDLLVQRDLARREVLRLHLHRAGIYG
jgi:hypothetical protein